MTGDRWHKTRDMWHVTCDTWHIVWDEHSLKFQLPSSFSLGLTVFWIYFHKPWLTLLILLTLMSNEAVYRTARATPGLLIMATKSIGLAKFLFLKKDCSWHRMVVLSKRRMIGRFVLARDICLNTSSMKCLFKTVNPKFSLYFLLQLNLDSSQFTFFWKQTESLWW